MTSHGTADYAKFAVIKGIDGLRSMKNTGLLLILFYAECCSANTGVLCKLLLQLPSSMFGEAIMYYVSLDSVHN